METPGPKGVGRLLQCSSRCASWIDALYGGPIRILEDAEGVLAGMVNFVARAPLANVMALEAARILAPRGRQL